MISTQEWIQRWQSGMSQAGARVKAGVGQVTQNPAEKAAANEAGYLAGVNASVGKWRAGLQRTTLQQWQTAMSGKGVQNMATGAAAAGPKMNAVVPQLASYVQQGLSQLPQGTDAASRQQRMIQWSQYMASFRKQ